MLYPCTRRTSAAGPTKAIGHHVGFHSDGSNSQAPLVHDAIRHRGTQKILRHDACVASCPDAPARTRSSREFHPRNLSDFSGLTPLRRQFLEQRKQRSHSHSSTLVSLFGVQVSAQILSPETLSGTALSCTEGVVDDLFQFRTRGDALDSVPHAFIRLVQFLRAVERTLFPSPWIPRPSRK